MTVPLWLDHVSVAVPALTEAVEHLERRLGLHTTVTPADPHRHGRVPLDRAYLEVAARPGQIGWGASLFFLRFDDPVALRDHLVTSGLPYRFTEYLGADGVWDDVEIIVDGVTMPILVRRTAPPELSTGWPPPLARPHQSPVRTLASVHVGITEPRAASSVYGRLLGIVTPAGFDPEIRLPLAAGEVVLVRATRAGIAGVVLGVSSIEEMADYLGESLEPSGDGVAWLDPQLTMGLRLGVAEDEP